MSRPLEGVRVLDLTQFLAGPYCTTILGDMGADVIKVEPPTGDPQRKAMKVAGSKADDAPAFFSINRNKRSLVIDLVQAEGKELFYDLVRRSDVLVENFKPGTAEKLGIGYERLREARPELIYASITGFGDRGRYADRPGLDLISQGMTGLMSVTGQPGSEPAKAGVPVTDLNAGMHCAIGILCAYIERLRSGEGQRVTTSLFQAGLALGVHESTSYWMTGEAPPPLGSAHRFVAPYQALRTGDGYLTVGVASDKMWRSFCSALGRSELADDERFADNSRRMQNRVELQSEIETALAHGSTEEWVEKILAAGIPSGPILDYAQVLADPHTRDVGMLTEFEHPQAGRFPALGTPFRLSRDEQPPPVHPPLLGEHTEQVLCELGIDPRRITRLRQARVVN